MQTHRYTTTCRKKESIECRFNNPWALSDKNRIVPPKEKIDETTVKQSKNLIDKVLSYVITISDLSYILLSEILEGCGVIAETYYNRTCIGMCGKKSFYII